MNQDFRLETERLVLRRLNVEDARFVLTLLNEPGWLRFIGDRGIRTVEAAANYITDIPVASYALHGYGLYHVAMRESGEPVGISGLVRRDGLEGPDLGFAFLDAHSGKGLATEAGAVVLEHAQQELGLRSVLALTSKDNAASVRVLAKLGFESEGEVALDETSPALRLFAWQAD